MNGPRHMAPPRPVRRVAVLLTVWVVLFAGVSGAACSMAPRESPPPSTVSDRCGETGVCEGSLVEWEEWELLPTGQVRLLDRSSGDNRRGAVG